MAASMKAWVLEKEKPPKEGLCLRCKALAKPVAGKGAVVVKLWAAGLNHRDQWCLEGKYPGLRMDCPMGSDGCGEVVALGEGTSAAWLGQDVIINPNIDWGSRQAVQSERYHIRGLPSAGTFAEYVSVPADRLHVRPRHLSRGEAAVLPLAGLTAYRALFYHGRVQASTKVLITGIGGGVALMALPFACAVGAEVTVSSRVPEKLQGACAMGAREGLLCTAAEGLKKYISKKSFEVIVDGSAGALCEDYLQLLEAGGRLVCYGATAGLPKDVDVRRLFWKQLTLQGSTMGSDKDFEEMLAFVNTHGIIPQIDSAWPFTDLPQALAKMKAGKQMGKLFITMDAPF